MSGKSKPNIKSKSTLVTATNAPPPPPSLEWRTIDVGEFNQMIHVSDIHIRPLHRHEEYYQVFKNLKDMIARQAAKERSVIVVTGDLFDHKTSFRPETFKVCRDFLKTLTSVAPVILIAGNHDMLEHNTSRLDSLTPVIDDIPGVHYCKTSGVYQSAKTDDVFVVSSLYDKVFIPHELLPANLNARTICLYHGDITRSSASEDEGGTTRNRSKEDFNGFDAVLLGDIHIHQVFKNDRDCSIAYAGSLIQQNHGEPMDGHGFLVWNRTQDGLSWDHPRHYKVNNDYGFVDVHCINGEWVKDDTPLPKHCYARMLIRDCTQTQLDLITAELKRAIPEDGSIVITKKHAIGVNRTEETETEPNPDQTRKDDEILMILDQAKEQGMDGEKLVSLHRTYQEKVDSVVCMSTAVWRPVWVEFKNLFGYGGGAVNYIRFKRGLTSISAGNACGKSSVVNALLFGIFGRAPLNPSSSATYDVVNNRETSGYIKVLLSHGGVYYLIERHSCKPKTKTTAVDLQRLTKFDFTCEIWESNLNGDKLVNRCDVRQNNNDKFIVELFGDLTDFSLTNLLNKESSLDLLSMTPADQIKTLKSLFKMDVYDKYRDMNKKKILELESIMSVTRGKLQSFKSLIDDSISDEELTVLKQSLALRQGDLEEDEENLTRIQEEIQDIQTECRLHMSNIQSRSKGAEDRSLADLQEELDNLGVISDPGLESLEVLQVTLKNINRRIHDMETSLKGIDWSVIQSKEELLSIIDDLNEELKMSEPPEHLKTVGLATLNKRLGALQAKLDEIESDGDGASACDPSELKSRIDQATASLITWALPLRKGRDRLVNILKDRNIANITRPEIPSSDLKVRIQTLENTARTYRDTKILEPCPEETMDILESSLKPGVSTEYTRDMEKELKKLNKELLRTRQELDQATEGPKILDRISDCIVIQEDWLKESGLEGLDPGDHRLIPEELVESIYVNFEGNSIAWPLMNRIATLEQQIQTLTDIKTNADVWSKLQWLKQIQTAEQLEELKLALCQAELYEMSEELKAHDHNDQILKEIDALKEQLSRAERLAGRDTIVSQIDDINQMIDYYEIQQDIKTATKNLSYLDLRQELTDLKCEHTSLTRDIGLQSRWETYEELSSLIESYHVQKHVDTLQAKLSQSKKDYAQAKESLQLTQQAIKKISDEISLMEFKIRQQQQYSADIQTLTDEMLQFEQDHKLHSDYNILMGSKGIASKMLYEKIKSIETYINSILKTFTRYTISIMFDDKKQTILIVADDIDTAKSLSITRFSGYEKLMLQLAFKRALNKYSFNSKSSLIIIDEALDCIDMENFQAKLPDVMNMITQDYSTCLAISQRDVSHISDNNMVIVKDDIGTSRLKVA
jgi:DNA repair exonuclease SbcCD ATPase subunit/DNA repair exonuclease SbcCD nuclease subunit